MKADNILKADVLDIIFQNKNKEYGAYTLRKFYNNRLKKSLAITTLLVLVFAGLQSWKTPKKITKVFPGQVVEIDLEKFEPEEKKKLIDQPKSPAKKIIQQENTSAPVIVKAIDSIKPITEVKNLDNVNLGNKHVDGEPSDGLVGSGKIPGGKGFGTDSIGEPVSTRSTTDEPIENPSENAQYPGGIEALKQFMLRNLRQPDDIEEGQKVIVIARFVVDKMGNISNVEVIQNGREDLDDEVMRVIQKMPRWKPGLQNGNPVSVYFKIPVTFTNIN